MGMELILSDFRSVIYKKSKSNCAAYRKVQEHGNAKIGRWGQRHATNQLPSKCKHTMGHLKGPTMINFILPSQSVFQGSKRINKIYFHTNRLVIKNIQWENIFQKRQVYWNNNILRSDLIMKYRVQLNNIYNQETFCLLHKIWLESSHLFYQLKRKIMQLKRFHMQYIKYIIVFSSLSWWFVYDGLLVVNLWFCCLQTTVWTSLAVPSPPSPNYTSLKISIP